MKKLKIIFSFLIVVSCSETNLDKFTFSTWVGAGSKFDKNTWTKKINYYDSLGISEILVGGSPDILKKIIPLANKKILKYMVGCGHLIDLEIQLLIKILIGMLLIEKVKTL